MLQHTLRHCSTLQHSVTHCNALRRTHTPHTHAQTQGPHLKGWYLVHTRLISFSRYPPPPSHTHTRTHARTYSPTCTRTRARKKHKVNLCTHMLLKLSTSHVGIARVSDAHTHTRTHTPAHARMHTRIYLCARSQRRANSGRSSKRLPFPVHCSTLQHTATHCNILQRTATHCTVISSHTSGRYIHSVMRFRHAGLETSQSLHAYIIVNYTRHQNTSIDQTDALGNSLIDGSMCVLNPTPKP